VIDKIFIEGLRVNTIIGAYDYERNIVQTLIIDIVANYDIALAAKTDNLSHTLDYAEISEKVRQFAQNNHFMLVETFAEQLAQILLKDFKISHISLKVGKPCANPNAKLVGVQITRSASCM